MGALLSLLGAVFFGGIERRHPSRRPESPPTCPICLDPIKVSKGKDQQQTSVRLACDHQLCRKCLRSYAVMKIRDREVEYDQLVCPIVHCKRSLSTEDLRRILDHDAFLQYERTLRRVRDEKNPLARWCPRPQCGELVVCEPGARTFSCPKCATVACVGCRGLAHWFAFLCRAKTWTSDASFSAWARSVGGARAVRACPQCQIQVWKNGGCNHMQCTRCRFQYCWVCNESWASRHYQCREPNVVTRVLGADVRARLKTHAIRCGWFVLALVLLLSFVIAILLVLAMLYYVVRLPIALVFRAILT